VEPGVTDTDCLADKVLRLPSSEAAEILRSLLLDADLRAGTARPGSNTEARIAADSEFLLEVAHTAGIAGKPSSTASSQQLLSALVAAIPAARESVDEALTSLGERETSLDIAASIDLASIAIAASAAIIRPLVTFEKEKDGDRETTRLKIDVRGVKDLGNVISATLPFLTGGSGNKR
jgi:hypothetical protein